MSREEHFLILLARPGVRVNGEVKSGFGIITIYPPQLLDSSAVSGPFPQLSPQKEGGRFVIS